MATYTIQIDERTKEGKKLAKMISDYEDKMEKGWLVKKTKEALNSKDYKHLNYTIKIDERTREGKKLAKMISDYEDKMENDWLVKKTKEALNSKDYKTYKMKNSKQFFKSLGWN